MLSSPPNKSFGLVLDVLNVLGMMAIAYCYNVQTTHHVAPGDHVLMPTKHV